jgi:hypothetical protein
MAAKKEVSRKSVVSKQAVQVVDHAPLFGKSNYIFMLVGALVIALGMVLMAGGKNDDPNVFDPNQVYSKTRLTVAPLLIVLGLVIEIYAIFKKK